MFIDKVLPESQNKVCYGIDLPRAKMLQAYIYGMESKWVALDAVLTDLTSSIDLDNPMGNAAYHVLALSHLRRNAYAEAIHFCKKARKLRRKAFGKNSSLFAESLLLLAKICEADGDSIKGEAYKKAVLPEYRGLVDLEPTTYLKRLLLKEKDAVAVKRLDSVGSAGHQETKSTQHRVWVTHDPIPLYTCYCGRSRSFRADSQ